ncbi:hypothetical protein LTS18_000518, partial [Coniosporium uncinatum]
MHSTLVRAQNVFGYFTSVAFAVAAIIAVSVIISPQTPTANIELRNVQVVKGRPHYYSRKKEEYAHVKFDVDMGIYFPLVPSPHSPPIATQTPPRTSNLSTLFNWNTKQVFLYILAEYPSPSPSSEPPTQAIIWDAIIPSTSAPWHHNQYIHPHFSTSSSARRARGPAYASTKPGDAPGKLKLRNQKP